MKIISNAHAPFLALFIYMATPSGVMIHKSFKPISVAKKRRK